MSFLISCFIPIYLTFFLSSILEVSFKPSSDLEQKATLTPSFDKDFSEANPRPLVPPVISAFLPFIPKSIFLLLLLLN